MPHHRIVNVRPSRSEMATIDIYLIILWGFSELIILWGFSELIILWGFSE
jgi:hypothetical protein